MDILQRIIDYLYDFNPADKKSVIVLALLMCLLTRYCIRAIYTTSIEEIFMNTKEKLVTDVFKVLVMLVVFISTNIVLTIDPFFALIELVVCVIWYILYLIYCRKERKTNMILKKQNKALYKLQVYYKDKQTMAILMIVLFFMPAVIIVCKSVYKTLPLFACLVIASAIEVFIIGILLPELFVKKAKNYLKNGEEKMFIYKRMKDASVICGDDECFNKASKYIVISIDELKTKEIYHLQSEIITKDEKRDLCKKFKKMRKEKKQN